MSNVLALVDLASEPLRDAALAAGDGVCTPGHDRRERARARPAKRLRAPGRSGA